MQKTSVIVPLMLVLASALVANIIPNRNLPGGEWAYPRQVPHQDPPPSVLWGPYQVPDLRGLQWGFYGMSYWGLKEQLHACYFWQNQIHRYKSADSSNPSYPDTIPMATIPSPVSDSFQDLAYCRYDQSVWLHSSKYKAVYKLDAATGVLKRQFPSPALRYPTGIAFNEREKTIYLCDRMPEGVWPCSLYIVDTTGYVLARHGLSHLGYSYSGARCLDMDYTSSNPNWPTLLMTYTFFSGSGTLDSTVLFELDRNTLAILNRFRLPNLAGYVNNVRGVAWDPRSGDYWIGIMQNPDNHIYKLSGWHLPLSIDAGLMSLEGARGSIESATTVTPHVTVRNFGNSEASIPVRLRIGTVYDESRTKTIRGGAEDTVVFPDWTPGVVGSYAVRCSTGLSGDMFAANDTWTEIAQVVRIGKDVGCNAIIAPAGLIDSGISLIPRCSTYNYGSQTVSYSVRLRIGSFYDETTFVTGHLPGNYKVCSLPPWRPAATGQFTVSCSTRLSGDRIQSNDRTLGEVTVRTQDIGVSQIVAPVGTIDSGTQTIPRVTVRNYRTHASTAPVWFFISTVAAELVYEDSALVSIPGGESLQVEFEPWVASPPGAMRLASFTALVPDVNRTNDTAYGLLVVRRPLRDVGTVAIITPADTVDTGTTVIPAALVRNYGGQAETFPVRFRIGGFYSHDTTISLLAGSADTVRFAPWHISQPGTHIVSCSTMLSGDMNNANDRRLDTTVVLATAIKTDEAVPTTFVLNQIKPNPFSTQTTIHYGLPYSSTVQLAIYNSAGTLVARLVDGTQPAGWHRVDWQDQTTPAGVYYCQMNAGGSRFIHKLLKTR